MMRKSYSVSLDLYYMYRQGKSIRSLYIYALRDILPHPHYTGDRHTLERNGDLLA